MKGGFKQVKNKDTATGGGFVIMIDFAKMFEHSAHCIETFLNLAGTYLVPGKIRNEDMNGSILVHCTQCKLDFLTIKSSLRMGTICHSIS